MNTTDTPDSPIQPTPEEVRLLEQLRSNPLMAGRLTHIMDRFEAEVSGGGDAHQAEAMIIDELRQLGLSMLGQWAGTAHSQSIRQAKEADATLTNHAKKKLRWHTTFGDVGLEDQSLRRGRRGRVVRPFLERAKVGNRACSLPLQRRIADFGAERSGRCAVDALQEHYGIGTPLYAVEAVTRRVARDCAGFNLDRPRQPDPASEVQVAELDGSMVPIVEFAPPQEAASPGARTDKRKRRRCLWKEVRVCTAHDTGRASARYGACFGGALESGCMMDLTLKQNGLGEHTRIHGIADGAPWIAEQFEKQFGLQHTFLIDFYHLCEYLGAAAASCAGADCGHRDRWLGQQKERLKSNRHHEVVAELEPHLETGDTPDESAPVRKCLRYLKNRAGHLDYQSAIARGLPIGSGEVESAHRHVVQRRLKLAGAWWSPGHAANVVQLRVTRANQQWDQFWQQKAAA